MHTSKAKEESHSTPSHRQVGVQPSPRNLGFITPNGDLGTQHHSKCPHTFLLLPPLYILSIVPYGLEYPFDQWGTAVPAVSSPSASCTPSLLSGGMG